MTVRHVPEIALPDSFERAFGRADIVKVQVLTDAEFYKETAHPPTMDLMGIKEAAEQLGVSRQRLIELLEKRPDFPRPVAELASGKVFTGQAIKRFDERWERRTGRPRKQVSPKE